MPWYHGHIVFLSRLKPLLHEHDALVVGAASAATRKRHPIETNSAQLPD